MEKSGDGERRKKTVGKDLGEGVREEEDVTKEFYSF